MKRVYLLFVACLALSACGVTGEEPEPQASESSQQVLSKIPDALDQPLPAKPVRAVMKSNGARQLVAYMPANTPFNHPALYESSLEGVVLLEPALLVALPDSYATEVFINAKEEALHRGEEDPLPAVGRYAGQKSLKPVEIFVGEQRLNVVTLRDGAQATLFSMDEFEEALSSRLHTFSFYGKDSSGGWLRISGDRSQWQDIGPGPVHLRPQPREGGHHIEFYN